MNRIALFCASAAVSSWALPGAYGFYHPFASEPLVTMMPAQVAARPKVRFSVQHNFSDGRIAAASIRAGYALTGVSDVYATALFNSLKIASGGLTAGVDSKELEGSYLLSLIREKDGKPLNLSVHAGLSSSLFKQNFAGVGFSDRQTYYFGNIVLSRTLGRGMLLAITPSCVSGNGTVIGAVAGTRVMLDGKLALVAEYGVHAANPPGWRRPWSGGIQFDLGPHKLTLFATNVYGLTISNFLQGLGREFYGFRFNW